jgi:hypothetical protein
MHCGRLQLYDVKVDDVLTQLKKAIVGLLRVVLQLRRA